MFLSTVKVSGATALLCAKYHRLTGIMQGYDAAHAGAGHWRKGSGDSNFLRSFLEIPIT